MFCASKWTPHHITSRSPTQHHIRKVKHECAFCCIRSSDIHPENNIQIDNNNKIGNHFRHTVAGLEQHLEAGIVLGAGDANLGGSVGMLESEVFANVANFEGVKGVDEVDRGDATPEGPRTALGAGVGSS